MVLAEYRIDSNFIDQKEVQEIINFTSMKLLFGHSCDKNVGTNERAC